MHCAGVGGSGRWCSYSACGWASGPGWPWRSAAAVVTGFTRPAFRLNRAMLLCRCTLLCRLPAQYNARRQERVIVPCLVAPVAAVALLVVCVLMGLPLTGYPLQSYAAMAAVALLAQVGGWLLISYALGHVSASAAVVVLLAQPVVTGLLSIPLLGEPLTVPQLAGGACLLTGIYLCLRATDAEL